MNIIRSFILLFISIYVRSSEVLTCGGFIKASSRLTEAFDFRLDYSFVKMHLFTKEGLLKYSTECAPNGYYFIPVYDQGSFYLEIEGPDGWTFEPARYPFTVTANQDTCKEDINFLFTGFALSGQVMTSQIHSKCQSTSGPAGIELTLFTNKNNNRVRAQTTMSNPKGEFRFENLFPGDYIVLAQHSRWTMFENEQSITMGMGNANLPKPFLVEGYSLFGKVRSANDPVHGVDIFLYSENVKIVKGCQVPHTTTALPDRGDARPLCWATSDAQGDFVFHNLPCGEYLLIPYYKRIHTTFDVQPDNLPVVIENGDKVISRNFQVLGFSAQGRVVDGQGNGLSQVQVIVNNVVRSNTDENGEYRLDVTSGKYTITASKPGILFTTLPDVNLTPSSSKIADIKISKVNVCGVIPAEHSFGRTVAITSDGKDRQETKTDGKGTFCFQVSPGVYTVTPFLTESERSKGIVLSPPNRVLTVTDTPIEISFSQARVSLTGKLRCLGSCATSISVSLSNTLNRISLTQHVDQHAQFKFDHLSPGTYQLSVDYDSYCWQQTTIQVEVGLNDVKDVYLDQSGYSVHVSLSHDVQLEIVDQEGDAKLVTLKRGENRICLDSAGVYQIRPISCYRFHKDIYIYDTSKPVRLDLQATEFRVAGILIVLPDHEGRVTPQTASFVHLEATPNQANRETVIVKAEYKKTVSLNEYPEVVSKLPNDIKPNHAFLYEYSFWASPSDKFSLKPLPTLSLMFYPRSVEAAANQCPSHVATIVGREGFYITGKVTPPVENVEITIKSPGHPDFFDQVLTNLQGVYHAGPYYDDQHYSVAASLLGYHFTTDESLANSFKALKLAEVIISVKSKSEDGQLIALPGVLLSLSGSSVTGETYKNNQVSDANGSYRFIGLVPGQYYVRPLLKEYEFSPVSLIVDVRDAMTEEKSFTATRHGFSVFGTVTSLAGLPEKGIVVEALETSSHQKKFLRYEEATSDENGRYRLLGLAPGSQYRVALKKGPNVQNVERSSPDYINITVNRNDVHGLDFISFRKSTKHDLVGFVLAPPQYLDSVEVTLASGSNPQQVIKTSQLSPSLNFFDFSSLPAGNYIVTARSNLPARNYDISLSSQTVALQQDTQIQLSIQIKPKDAIHDDIEASPGSLMFAVFLTAVFLYYKQIFLAIQGVSPPLADLLRKYATKGGLSLPSSSIPLSKGPDADEWNTSTQRQATKKHGFPQKRRTDS